MYIHHPGKNLLVLVRGYDTSIYLVCFFPFVFYLVLLLNYVDWKKKKKKMTNQVAVVVHQD